MDAAINGGVDGLVYAGVGNGNVYSDTMEGLKDAMKNGISVVVSSRTGSGRVDNGETDFKNLGMVTADTEPSKEQGTSDVFHSRKQKTLKKYSRFSMNIEEFPK